MVGSWLFRNFFLQDFDPVTVNFVLLVLIAFEIMMCAEAELIISFRVHNMATKTHARQYANLLKFYESEKKHRERENSSEICI